MTDLDLSTAGTVEGGAGTTSPTTMSTGVADLDRVFGPLVDGDNVVWVAEDDERYRLIEAAFVEQARRDRRPVLVVAGTVATVERERGRGSGADLRGADGVDVLDATPGSALAPAAVLADELDRRLAARRGICVVVDDLGALARRWGAADAQAFFARTCPSMLQAGAITTWRLPRRLGLPFVERVRSITQWLLEFRGDRLHVIKAESAPRTLQGRVVEVTVHDGVLRVADHPTSGRLARGLVTLRRDLGLTQAQLATAAGVTPSAISQAESGARGLSIDTLLTMADSLRIPLDRIVAAAPEPGYRLARHDRDRRAVGPGTVALADDSRIGLRAHLVVLPDTIARTPPLVHDGVELVAVLRGLVQVDTGEDAPVLRAGDTALLTTARVRSWRNLRPDPAAFYWILRDHQQGWSDGAPDVARP